MPNINQIFSIIRWLLTAGGPLGAFLVARGLTADQVTSGTEIVLATLATLPPLVSFILSMRAHTTSGSIAAVEAVPEVKTVVVQPKDYDGIVAAAARDPARPKVVTETQRS